MATTGKTTGTGGQAVGRVVSIYDKAKAISADGMERLLSLDSPVFADDRIITEGDGRVSMVIDDAVRTRIDLDRMSEVLIDEDIFGGSDSGEIAETTAEMEQVQEVFFLEDIDLTVESEEYAAGSELSAGGGHPVAHFDRGTHDPIVSSNPAGKVSEFFDHGDYIDPDNGGSGDSLVHLIDPDDTSS